MFGISSPAVALFELRIWLKKMYHIPSVAIFQPSCCSLIMSSQPIKEIWSWKGMWPSLTNSVAYFFEPSNLVANSFAQVCVKYTLKIYRQLEFQPTSAPSVHWATDQYILKNTKQSYLDIYECKYIKQKHSIAQVGMGQGSDLQEPLCPFHKNLYQSF